MSQYAILAGVSLVFAAFSSKTVLRAVRQSRIQGAGGLSFNSARAKLFMGPFESPMSKREASLVLGVRENATEEKILTSHKRLMLLNHPDFGGSTFIATKINEAKEIMLLK